ncbi:TrkA family potassium uptake protein [bacterium]|jgi:trk system potassium uptake protein|nr:TrkA family potassium uptake protein [bacterium]
MENIAVIGLGQFGTQIAISLTQKGFEVTAIDQNKDVIMNIKDMVSDSVIVDSTDEKDMRAINIHSVDKVIVAMGSNVQASLLTTALLQRMGIKKIYVRAINPLQESILKSMSIDYIINIEKEMGIQFSNSISTKNINKYIEISDRHSIIDTVVPEFLIGKALKELHLRSHYGINVVGIKTRVPEVDDTGEIRYSIKMMDIPDPNYPLRKNDLLVMFGTDEKLNSFLAKDSL